MNQLEILAEVSKIIGTGASCAAPASVVEQKEESGKPGKLEKRVFKNVGKAIADFNLIEEGDRVLVAISGGKDSWVMMYVLEELRKRAPINFELVNVNIDQGYRGYRQDLIEDVVEDAGYDYAMEEFNIADIVAEKVKPGDVPCSLCARLRRGKLTGLAEKHGCNKIALGHHMDDFIETLLLNMFYVGKVAAMAPKLTTEAQKITVIRPLMYCEEEDIKRLCAKKGFPIVCCQCPLACGNNDQLDSKRVFMKRLLKVLEAKIPNIRQSLLTSLGNIKPSHMLDRNLIS
jgi:tRNA 2-thiocytidine biosynthesis protein TtcA